MGIDVAIGTPNVNIEIHGKLGLLDELSSFPFGISLTGTNMPEGIANSCLRVFNPREPRIHQISCVTCWPKL